MTALACIASCLVALHLLVLGAAAQSVPLVNLQPSSVLSYYPKSEAAPKRVAVRLFGDVSVPALRFMTESEVSYAVPPGQNSFSGILIYQPATDIYQPLHVRILGDNALLWERGMDRETPAVKFSIRLAGSSRVTIVSTAPLVGETFQLARAEFKPENSDTRSDYLPASNAGYVDCAPLPRQALLGIYHPEEPVLVTAAFAGPAKEGLVTLRTSPESPNAAPSESHLTIPLRTLRSGLSRGDVAWRMPRFLGPAAFDIILTVNGRTVFQRHRRIAAGPAVDLAGIPDNPFGLHLSSSGFPMLYDEFAGLWGAKWGRLFVRWPVLELHRGEYDFSRIDKLIDIYRSQHMRILVVLGEDAPSWIGPPGLTYYAAWKQYVANTVKHLAGKVDAWDVFNEVDAKYEASLGKAESSWDLQVLRLAIQTIRATDPRASIVCCSTGTTNWLLYDKKLFDASLLGQIDIVSFHPYQFSAPEEKDGVFDYRDSINALHDLLGSYGSQMKGPSKDLWATEANWLLGKAGARNVTTPGLTEEIQARYLVRVNLLSDSEGVKYFVHMPFATSNSPLPHLATWAAYAEMAELFSRTPPKMLIGGPYVYGLLSATPSQVGALWSVEGQATVALIGSSDYRFMDLYGNPVSRSADSIQLSPEPLYFTAKGAAPHLQVIQAVVPSWRPLQPLTIWTCNLGSTCTQVPGGRHIQSQASKYSSQLTSPPVAASPGSCHRVRMQLVLDEGAIGLFAIDGSTGALLDHIVRAAFVPEGRPHILELRFHAGSSSSFKLVVGNSNATDSPSVFTLLDPPQIADCP
jgi:hypothetical protein